MPTLDHRTFLTGTAGVGILAARGLVRAAEARWRPRNQRIVEADLTAQPATVGLEGIVVPTWVYGDSVPGPLLRARPSGWSGAWLARTPPSCGRCRR